MGLIDEMSEYRGHAQHGHDRANEEKKGLPFIEAGKTVKKAAAFVSVLFVFFLFGLSFRINAQDASSNTLLASELERLAGASSSPGGKREALKSMARLYQLSGRREKALEAWKGAFDADAANPDYIALLEASRLLVSMGEYEKAETELRRIPSGAGEETIREARLLAAQAAAFGRGDTVELVSLATAPVYASGRPGIYYTLWKVTGSDSWKSRLASEFPHSPEALAARASGNLIASSTPLWLLFPGQGLMKTETPKDASLAAADTKTAVVSAGSADNGRVTFLQTGLFGKAANAKAMTERLEKAGFNAQVHIRKINGADYWAVTVDGGRDSARMLLELKNAGFEAFPVFE